MDVVSFLLFLAYITTVFFLPNGPLVWGAAAVNGVFLLGLAIWRRSLRPVWTILRRTASIIPFVLFTMAFNWWLDSWQSALWIGLKLLIVTSATMFYGLLTTVNGVANIIVKLLAPLRVFGVKPSEVRILVSVSLMMIPILRKDLREMRQACRAKGAAWDVETVKMVLQKLGWTLLIQVNQLEEGLLAKGYEIED